MPVAGRRKDRDLCLSRGIGGARWNPHARLTSRTANWARASSYPRHAARVVSQPLPEWSKPSSDGSIFPFPHFSLAPAGTTILVTCQHFLMVKGPPPE
jgi:hypothetical protein